MPNFNEEFRVLGAEACRSVTVLVSAIIRSPGPLIIRGGRGLPIHRCLTHSFDHSHTFVSTTFESTLESRISQLGRRLKEFILAATTGWPLPVATRDLGPSLHTFVPK